MPTAAEFLSVPQGWNIATKHLVADINSVPPSTVVELEISQDFYAVSVFGLGDVVNQVPSIAQQLDQAAQQYGSRVYMVALLHTQDFNVLGVSVDRYRWVIVHSQFQALLVLIALPLVISIVGVWLECQGQSLSQCGQQLQTDASSAAQAMCNIFGAGCALQALGNVLLAASAVSIGGAFLLFFFESGIASSMGIRAPALPRIPTPQLPQAPRVSASVGPPGGPRVSVSTGGRGGRRGLGGLSR